MIFYILLALYFLIIIGFFFAVYRENLKNDYDFNILQLIVVVFWPIWGGWYLWELASEAITNWRKK